MNAEEKHIFYETLSNIKVPEGYCSNFKNLVFDDPSKMTGLKSNDCHVLMQQLLSFAIKGGVTCECEENNHNFVSFFQRVV